MLELNQEFLLEIAADAIVQAELNLTDKKERTRWVNAIAKGVKMFEERSEFMTWMDDKSLLIWSDSNQIYSANGVCTCQAFIRGLEMRNKPFPCKHRALARLVRLYFELTEIPNRREETCAAEPQTAVSNIPPSAVNPLPAKTDRSKQSCGCVFNWDDKFTEKYCDKHWSEAEEAEAEYVSHLSEFNNAPYLKMSSNRKPEKIGNIRI